MEFFAAPPFMPIVGTYEEHGCTVAVVGMSHNTVFVRVSSQLECIGLIVWPTDAVVYSNEINPTCDRFGIELTSQSSTQLTASSLRKLRNGEVQFAAIEAVKTFVGEPTERGADVYRNWALAERSNPRRKNQKDPLWYALLARDYVNLREHRNVTERLAEKHHLAMGTIGGEIRKARKMGLLTGTIKGRSGGQLTPKAWALLNTQTEKEIT